MFFDILAVLDDGFLHLAIPTMITPHLIAEPSSLIGLLGW